MIEKMPKWSAKDKRQYEHIKDSSLDAGKSEDTAEEIAARTVNKRRRQEGRSGVELYVKDWGVGRPLVLIHGWP